MRRPSGENPVAAGEELSFPLRYRRTIGADSDRSEFTTNVVPSRRLRVGWATVRVGQVYSLQEVDTQGPAIVPMFRHPGDIGSPRGEGDAGKSSGPSCAKGG